MAYLNEEELKMMNDLGSCVLQKEVEIANDAYGYNEVKRWMNGSAAATLRGQCEIMFLQRCIDCVKLPT